MENGSFKTGRPNLTPYNTGKVMIGCRYEVPAVPLTYEETQVQSVLLHSGSRNRRFWRMFGDLVAIAVGLAIVVLVISV
jgi:hypothetical protein